VKLISVAKTLIKEAGLGKAKTY